MSEPQASTTRAYTELPDSKTWDSWDEDQRQAWGLSVALAIQRQMGVEPSEEG
jgi:hypothetical protein